MRVTKLASIGKGLEKNEEKRRFILNLFALCNDARREGTRILAEPTEKALAEAAEEGGVSLKGLWKEMPRIGEVPFSSERIPSPTATLWDRRFPTDSPTAVPFSASVPKPSPPSPRGEPKAFGRVRPG
jgi:hypothetical protein